MGSTYPSFTTSSSLLFFQVLRKEASQFPNWGQHFGRGNQPKGESIFTGKNFAIWKFRVRIFPARWDSRFKFSHSVHAGLTRIYLQKGRIYILPLGRNGWGWREFFLHLMVLNCPQLKTVFCQKGIRWSDILWFTFKALSSQIHIISGTSQGSSCTGANFATPNMSLWHEG